MAKHKDSHTRSIVKAISYRVCASIATTLIVFFFTRRLVLSISVGMVEAVAKMACYYLHERAWSFINFGKDVHPLSSLPVNRPLEEEDMEIIKNKLKDLGYLDED